MSGLWLGRRVTGGAPGEASLLDPAHLTRHAVVFGATGSGKTGLCVCLLEELALAGVPVLAIDPKGDLANLALRFRGPTAAEIRPWVDEGVVARSGLDADTWSAREAERWSAGRRDGGVDDARVARLIDAVEVVVHTPGSRSGVPVDVLGALRAPDADTLGQPEALADLAAGAVSALLELVGVQSDRLKDPEHIVLARVVEHTWGAGEDLDLERLILRLVDPPFQKVGVFPLESFFPRADRMKLAMQLNGLLASSGFDAWRVGEPLDMDRLLAPVGGRAPVRVFTLAHLDDARRRFFTGMLLHKLVAWSRRQPGTGALRAVLYLDEAFGYCPPAPHKPSTKEPILQLVKQARAVGLGVVITSQNPVDVDHAVIGNAGTWWLGRLATRQDQERMFSGLGPEEAAAIGGAVSSLGKWQFAVRLAGKDPYVVQTRHAITWLRGPMTLREIERLGGAPSVAAAAPAPRTASASVPVAAGSGSTGAWRADVPMTPSGYPVRWLDPTVAHAARFQEVVGEATEPARDDGATAWRPALYARLKLRFDEKDFVVDRDEDRLFYPIAKGGGFAGFPGFEEGDLLDAAPGRAVYEPIPETVDEPKELQALERRIVEGLLAGETERQFAHAGLGLRSRGGEDRAAFDARVQQAVRDKADQEVAKLKDKVDRELARLEEQHQRLQRDRDRHQADAQARVGQELMNAGEMMFGMFFGGSRKSLSGAMSKRDLTRKAQAKVGETDQRITDLAREIYELESRTEQEIEAIRRKWEVERGAVTEASVPLERDDVRLADFGIVWIPVSRSV